MSDKAAMKICGALLMGFGSMTIGCSGVEWGWIIGAVLIAWGLPPFLFARADS